MEALNDAWELSARLAGWALLLQTLEFLFLGESSRLPRWLQGLRLFSAIALVVWPIAPFLAMALVGALLTARAWSGSFNGGSDTMTHLLLTLLLLAKIVPETVAPWVLAYLAAQTCLSYFVAGCVKLRQRGWRAGTELAALLSGPAYDVPARCRALAARPGLLRTLSRGLLAFELLFPLALFSRPLAVGFMAVGVVFHLANFAVLGLNRFFWIWLAAYPVLFYFSGRAFSGG
jgi:hypothetical protein